MIRFRQLQLYAGASLALGAFLCLTTSCSVAARAQSAGPATAGSLPRTATTSDTFLVARSLHLGYTPSSVASADLRRSGKVDLVAADKVSGKITVFLNSERGSFARGIEYAAGPRPMSILVEDINNDGWPDVLLCNESAGTISVLRGAGDGELRPRQSYEVGFSPSFIAAGNFNGNGNTDVVVVGKSAKQLAVLLNDGNGNLRKPLLYSLRKTPMALAVADFDGDGHADLALANEDGTLTILFGQGEGLFRSVPDMSIASSALSSIVAGHFNHDGKVDLAITGEDSVYVLAGKGDGGFAPAVSYRVGYNPVSIVAGDVTGDAIDDLIVINQGDNTFSVLAGNGDGTFRAPLEYIAADRPVAAVVGDFDGDGSNDLAIIDQSSEDLTLVLGNGEGTFRAALAYISQLQPRAIASGSLTGDRRADFVVANYRGSDANSDTAGSVSVYLADDKGVYHLSSTYTVGDGPVSVALADVTGDGNLDILTLNRLDKTVSVLPGVGDGTFLRPLIIPLADAPVAIGIGDFDEDGRLDLAVVEGCEDRGCSQPSSLEILLGLGDGTFRSASTYTLGYSPSSIAVGDLNGDRHLDVVVANRCGEDVSCRAPGTAAILFGNGKGGFTAGPGLLLGDSPSSIALGDLAGRGFLDLLVSQASDDTLAVFSGNGDGSFRAPSAYKVGSLPTSIVVSDFNGDGKPDVAVANLNSSTVSIFFGGADGALRPGDAISVGTGPESLTAIVGAVGGHASLATTDGGLTTVGREFTVLPNIHPDLLPTLIPNLQALPNPASKVNQAVTLTASFSGNPTPEPTGTIVFDSNGESIPDCSNPTSLIAGVAKCITSSLQEGSDSLSAEYSGNSNYRPVVSNTVTQAVEQLVPTIELSVSPSDSTKLNTLLTFTVQLSGVALTPIAPTGTVNFTANGTSITDCNAIVMSPSGQATCTTSSLPAGRYTIEATYSGDTNFAEASAPPFTQTVSNLIPTLGLVVSPSSTSHVNSPVTFTAQLGAVALTPVVPTGTVNFTANGTSIIGCSATVVSHGGQATCTTSSLTAGQYTIAATYSGDNNFAAASAPSIVQVVLPAVATVDLTVSPSSTSSVNTPVTFTTQLSAAALTPTIPTGVVTFTTDGTVIAGCNEIEVTATGRATCTTSLLTAGTHNIVVAYSGDKNFAEFVASVSQTVLPLTPSLKLNVMPPGPVKVNAAATFTTQLGSVALTPVAPTGTVNFTVNGTSITGCGATVVSPGGQATCTTSSLTARQYTIAATYSGDNNFAAASAPSIVQVVLPAVATVDLTVSPPSTTSVNTLVTFTTQLSAAALTPTIPTGTVAFTVNGTAITGCIAEPVSTSGEATCETKSLAAGQDAIEATYSGDKNFARATSKPLQHHVSQLTPILNLTASPPSGSRVDEQITLTAQLRGVALTPVAPTGVVTFATGGNDISGCKEIKVSPSGSATCSTSSLQAGSDTIEAAYLGDANFAMPQAPSSITIVVLPNFGLAVSSESSSSSCPSPTQGSLYLAQGYDTPFAMKCPFVPVTVNLSSIPLGGFDDLLDVACKVVPVNQPSPPATSIISPLCTLSSQTLSGSSGLLTVSLEAPPDATVNTYSATITATDKVAGLTRRVNLSVVVLGALPSLTLKPGQAQTEYAMFNIGTTHGKAPSKFTVIGCPTIVSFVGGRMDISGWVRCSGPTEDVTVSSFSVPITVTVLTKEEPISETRRFSTIFAVAFLGLPLLTIAGWHNTRKSPRKNLFRILGSIALIMIFFYVGGCGGSFTPPQQPNTVTPPGVYFVLIKAEDDGLDYYAMVPLTVPPT